MLIDNYYIQNISTLDTPKVLQNCFVEIHYTYSYHIITSTYISHKNSVFSSSFI